MKKILIPILSIISLIGIDQFTKYLAKTNLIGNTKVIIDGVFELRYLENTGAAFGTLKGALGFFYVMSIVILAAITYVYIKYLQKDKFKILRVICILIFAGAIGNLIDRISYGYVIDFMYISLIDFPIFNFADMCVSLPLILAIILLLFKYKESDFKIDKKEEDISGD